MQKIGAYEIIEKVGQGGMCVVYRGRQVSLDRPVAIKVLSDKLTDHAEILERFNRESIIIARLNHPNIIHVIDRGITPEGMPYFVMEYVEGVDLAQTIKAGALDTNRKLDIIIQVCKALSYAHRNGVIHRDIKPANVLIDAEGNAQVLDFGISKILGETGGDGKATRPGVILGTVSYMSPEQQDSTSRVTAASDLYSLGVIMYELLTGIRPAGKFRPPSEIDPDIPKPLEDIIHRCLEPDPQDRFSSADEIKDRLLRLLQGAHLLSAQRERARQGLSNIGEKFSLLDVIKENPHGAVLLYQDKVDQRLLVIKKRINTTEGLSEAKLLTSLKHKNIVNIVGASGSERLFIIVMEYLSGGSLNDRLIQPLPWGEALRTAREICEGLSFAHRNRIVHGNLRPSNILFTESGQAKITDFGLAEHYLSEADGTNWYNVFCDPKLPRADIFAAGTIIYEMLTGSVPVWKGTQVVPNEYFLRLPAELQQMVTWMLSRDDDSWRVSFDQVIAEIDTLLAACEANPELPGATEMIDMSAEGEAAARAAARARRRKRLRWIIPAVGLLLAATAAYLVLTGRLGIDALPPITHG